MKFYGFCQNLIPGTDGEKSAVYSNKEFKWWPSDSPNNYNPNNNLYGPDDITYKFNTDGFRCDEFDISSNKRILFLGCSFTLGIGLPFQHTWAYILLDLIKKETGFNIPYWNLAVGGIGLDTMVRLFYHYGPKLKPQLMFGLFPEYRRELYEEHHPYLVSHGAKFPQNFKKFPYLVDPRIRYYETEKNLCFLDLIIKSLNSKLIHTTWAHDDKESDLYNKFQIPHNIEFIFDKKARDRMHTGYDAHTKFAQAIFDQHKDTIIDCLKD